MKQFEVYTRKDRIEDEKEPTGQIIEADNKLDAHRVAEMTNKGIWVSVKELNPDNQSKLKFRKKK